MVSAVSDEVLEAPAVTLALAISHTPWVPARVESMARLRKALRIGAMSMPEVLVDDGYLEMTDRAPNDVWSERMWRWAVQTSADWCLFLQDDVLVPDNFWPALAALLEALPAEAEVLGLETAHPAAGALCDEDVRLMTTADGLIGVGYAIRREALERFLAWRATELRPGWNTPGPGLLTEDTMIGLWCLATGGRVWHPIPTIIDHDVEIASTYGNDDHTFRRPSVTWKDAPSRGYKWRDEDLELPAFWRGEFVQVPVKDGDQVVGYQRAETIPGMIEPPRHLGRFYEASPTLARKHVLGFGPGEEIRARQDNGEREKRRLACARRARADWRPRARILVCTPTRGGAHPIYTSSMTALARLFEVDIDHGLELVDSWRWHEDLVRVRSRFMAAAAETDATHVYLQDADVGASANALLGMLRSGHDVVATPYPRRDGVDWSAIAAAQKAGDPRPLEAIAYHWPVASLPGAELVDDCIEVATMPLGCALISRRCFEAMIEHYDALDRDRVDLEKASAATRTGSSRVDMVDMICRMKNELERWRAGHMGLRFTDRDRGRMRESVALFQLVPRGAEGLRPLMSEDASFCMRWRDMGGKVWMYLGPGSPADHAGDHLYRGHIEAFGLKRITQQEALERARELVAASALEGQLADTTPPPATERPFALDEPEDPAREPQEPAVP